nr:glycosyltransferase family 4 protein [uncultured Flavobacterium sp.]
MPKQIVYFTKYARNGASSRLRSYQYIDLLQNEPNVKITVQNLFPASYIKNLYANSSTKKIALLGYLKRLLFLFTVFKYDKIIIEKELFPYFPAFFEWIFKMLNIKYMVDYDDAIFHNYDQHPNVFVQKILKNKIKKVMQFADVVMVGNQYLANYATQAQAKQIVLVPTVIDLNRYPIKNFSGTDKIIIGWIGTPKTIKLFEGNLKYIETDYQQNFKILTIGGKLTYTIVDSEFLPWSEQTEVDSISKIDVGIMPLLDSDFEKGKCGYKLIQYMACGIPVIASAVGVNCEIVQHGTNGFLVENPLDWKKHIQYFIDNKQKMTELGENARKTVENKYTLQVQYPVIKQLLEI